jgi:glycine cleavage system H protein
LHKDEPLFWVVHSINILFLSAMTIPEDLRYTKDHEWIKLLEDGSTALVGITDFAQHELGDIVFVELKSAGTALKQHEVFGTVEAVKTVADLFAPVAGELLELNPLLDSAEIVNQDPYNDGWLVKMKVASPEAVHALLDAEAYRQLTGE